MLAMHFVLTAGLNLVAASLNIIRVNSGLAGISLRYIHENQITPVGFAQC